MFRKPLCVLLGALLLSACNLLIKPTPSREVDPGTPEGAALAYIAGQAPDADAATISFSDIHTWSLGRDSLVAYSYAGGYAAQWSRCNGQARLTLAAGGWQVVEVGTHCWDDESAAITGLYAFVTDDKGDIQTVIYGDLLVPDVTAVSIEFAVGGESAVAELDSAGYWLMRTGAHPPTRAVAIDAAGYLVQMLDFGAPLTIEPLESSSPSGP